MNKCFIGLGSNLNDPVTQVKTAIVALQALPETQFICASSLYVTKPIGPQGQPDFINAVVALNTALTALALLDQLQKIENFHGRQRSITWGPRTLDLDLLMYGNEIIHFPELVVPHPELTKRQFVLQPLAEIAPDLNLPSGQDIKSFLKADGTVCRL